jgi:hypothetical protein
MFSYTWKSINEWGKNNKKKEEALAKLRKAPEKKALHLENAVLFESKTTGSRQVQLL